MAKKQPFILAEPPSEALFEQALYASKKVAGAFEEKNNPFQNSTFRELMRRATSPEQKKRIVELTVNGLTTLIDQYKEVADQAAAQTNDPDRYDLNKISTEKMGLKKGIIDLRDELQTNPALLAQTADAYYIFKKTAARLKDKSVQPEQEQVPGKNAADGLGAAISDISEREGPDAAMRKLESGMALQRIAKAFLGDKPFSLRHYGEGVSSAPEYKAEHDRIVLDYVDASTDKSTMSAKFLKEKMQKVLGDDVAIDYGVRDRTGKPFVTLRGKDGPLQSYDLESLAEKAEAAKGELRINRMDGGLRSK